MTLNCIGRRNVNGGVWIVRLSFIILHMATAVVVVRVVVVRVTITAAATVVAIVTATLVTTATLQAAHA